MFYPARLAKEIQDEHIRNGGEILITKSMEKKALKYIIKYALKLLKSYGGDAVQLIIYAITYIYNKVVTEKEEKNLEKIVKDISDILEAYESPLKKETKKAEDFRDKLLKDPAYAMEAARDFRIDVSEDLLRLINKSRDAKEKIEQSAAKLGYSKNWLEKRLANNPPLTTDFIASLAQLAGYKPIITFEKIE